MKNILFIFLALVLSTHAMAQDSSTLVFTLYTGQTLQQIRNIGASGCWFSEEIGTLWPAAKKERIAELLFSKEMDANGRPKGIGLSAFRYNIGAGTAEQGDSSGIKDPAHRVQCFLSPNGTYNWNKEQGYTWMLKQGKKYGVQTLIAFVNSPPVQFTKNGLGFKLVKDGSTNLREDKYEAYANFLSEVIKHFDKAGLHFNFISPVNEPQWDWSGTMGTAKQEGSPWLNEEIYNTVKALNSSLEKQKLNTSILITEAGMLSHLYAFNENTSGQINSFYGPQSPLYIGGMSHASAFIEGHGYFTDNGANLVNTRRALSDTIKKYNGLEFWQSEYCILGNGYKEKSIEKPSGMDIALFLAKVINFDFTVGNATAWHFWNSYEPGSAGNPLYFLIALNPKRATQPDSLYTVTKNLWVLGHYSRFVRPGMYRIETTRSDNLSDTAIAAQIMIAAFIDAKANTLVVNVINYTQEGRNIKFTLKSVAAGKPLKISKHYITSAKDGDDMKPYPLNDTMVPARSVSTFIFSNK